MYQKKFWSTGWKKQPSPWALCSEMSNLWFCTCLSCPTMSKQVSCVGARGREERWNDDTPSTAPHAIASWVEELLDVTLRSLRQGWVPRFPLLPHIGTLGLNPFLFLITAALLSTFLQLLLPFPCWMGRFEGLLFLILATSLKNAKRSNLCL